MFQDGFTSFTGPQLSGTDSMNSWFLQCIESCCVQENERETFSVSRKEDGSSSSIGRGWKTHFLDPRLERFLRKGNLIISSLSRRQRMQSLSKYTQFYISAQRKKLKIRNQCHLWCCLFNRNKSNKFIYLRCTHVPVYTL